MVKRVIRRDNGKCTTFTSSELRDEFIGCVNLVNEFKDRGSSDGWKAIAIGCLILTAMMIGHYVIA